MPTPSAPPVEASRFRLLVVEDDAVQQRAYSAVGRRYGYEISFADRTTDVLRVVLCDRPDAVVLDLNLVDGNSLGVLRTLRGSPETAGTPVAIVSGNLVPEITTYLERYDDVPRLAKPWHLDDLLALLEGLRAVSK